MISFFKRLFNAAKPVENSATDPQVDFAIGDLKKGFILDYDLHSWEVKEVAVYTWDNGVKEFEYHIFDGKQNLFLGYAPTDNKVNIFWEAAADIVWPGVRQKLREGKDITGDEFDYEGKKYHFSGEGTAMISNSIEKFEMQNWLFESEDEKNIISFNKYEDQTIGVYVGMWINFHAISNILPRKS